MSIRQVPLTEDFGLWMTLGRCPGAPISGGLESLADLGRCPLPLCGGLCHLGLVVLLDRKRSWERIVRG